MAKILGKVGRYVEDQSIKKTQLFVLLCIISLVILSVALGLVLAAMFYTNRFPLLSLPLLLALSLCIFFSNRYMSKRLAVLEREQIYFHKGAVGENIIDGVLKKLPTEYTVVHDVKTDFGNMNLDHVVVGPNGVFALDTKYWKGTVEDDSNGELLLNGRPTTKPEVKNLVRAVMSCREQVISICRSEGLQLEPYVHPILVFPISFVKVKWGTFRSVDCVTDQALCDYITKYKSDVKLSKQDIDSISRAFETLTEMDKNFPEQTSTVASS